MGRRGYCITSVEVELESLYCCAITGWEVGCKEEDSSGVLWSRGSSRHFSHAKPSRWLSEIKKLGLLLYLLYVVHNN